MTRSFHAGLWLQLHSLPYSNIQPQAIMIQGYYVPGTVLGLKIKQ